MAQKEKIIGKMAKYIPENKLINMAESLGLCSYNIEDYIRDFDVNYNNAVKCIHSKYPFECASKFNNLNDFFTRDVVNKWPITKYELLSPAESYVLIYKTIKESQTFWIKGTDFTVNKLLGYEPNKSVKYAIIINRLAPKHYHHFYSPVNGIITKITEIDGLHLSVNGEVIQHGVNSFTKNVRKVLEINTNKYGLIYYIIIGATCVYDIELNKKQGDKIKKGHRLGVFNFGGSTIVMLIPNEKIILNKKILLNSKNQKETEVQVRYPLGD